MNLILNRDFKMPDDGWCQLAPLGEFPHAVAGVIQVVDAEACAAMVARFKADAAVPNFAGLLVDFDHFSLDDRARSEAAGWIVGLEYRGQTTDQRPQTADPERDPHPNPLPSQGEGVHAAPGLWANIHQIVAQQGRELASVPCLRGLASYHDSVRPSLLAIGTNMDVQDLQDHRLRPPSPILYILCIPVKCSFFLWANEARGHIDRREADVDRVPAGEASEDVDVAHEKAE